MIKKRQNTRKSLGLKKKSSSSKLSVSRTSTGAQSPGTKQKRLNRSGRKTARDVLLLNKAVNAFKRRRLDYIGLLKRASVWFLNQLEKLLELIGRVQGSHTKVVTHDDFKAILQDCRAPFSEVELHALILLVDPDADGAIQVKDIENGILHFCQAEEEHLIKTLPSSLNQTHIRWVRVYFKYVTLAGASSHPLHFEKDVPSNYNMNCLAEVIRQHCRIISPEINFFIHKTALQKDGISASTSLIQLGLTGGTSLAPDELVLFYRPCGLPPAPAMTTSIADCSVAWTASWKEGMTEKEESKEDPLVTLFQEFKLTDEERKKTGSNENEDSESDCSLVTYISRKHTVQRREREQAKLVAKFKKRGSISEAEQHSRRSSSISPMYRRGSRYSNF